MSQHRFYQFFDEGAPATIERLGGKCASLVSMTEAGMPVPPGFAVTTDAFNEFLHQSGIEDELLARLQRLDIENLGQVDVVSAAIRDRIMYLPVPEEIRQEHIQAYRELQARFDKPVPVAVRSSATAEDLPGASFAGQQDTYLWVTGEESTLSHIRRCWASLYTARSLIYREKNNIPHEGLSMAVAVMKMVNSKVSGVAMTLNPTNGDRSKVAIDSSYGVGEMVVSGEVTPDNILVDKVMRTVVSTHIGDKHAELVSDADQGRLVHLEVSPERREVCSLSTEQIMTVADMAIRAEKHYGCPQDIEWALDADLPDGENLLLLQARPETVHSNKEVDASGEGGTGSTLKSSAIGGHKGKLKSFPRPSELAVPAGAEGWEELYPYHLRFLNLSGSDDDKFWFCDSSHWPTVFKPFETIGGEFAVKCLGQYNARHLLIPDANGIEFKMHLGYLYMSPIAVPADQIAARAPEFQRRAGYYFENWNELLEKWHVKVKDTIDQMEALEFENLPDCVSWEDHISGRATDGTEVLLTNFDRLIQLCYQNWQYHFEFLNLGYIAYLDFFGFCKEIFPGIPDQAIAKMVQGVDMELFKPDDELKVLAALAVEKNLDKAFADTRIPAKVLDQIAGMDGGQIWLDRWEQAKDPWFNFTVGNRFYGHDKYWMEYQEIPLGYIADYIRRLRDGQDIARPMESLLAERDHVIEGYRSTLQGDQLATFDAKRGLAATAYPYVENHNFYIEHWTMGVFWRKVRELSRVFVRAEFWSDPADMLYLNRGEVRDALADLTTAWGVGAEPTGPHYWPAEIERRRKIIDALKTARPQPALNTPPAEITEPFTMMLYGITTEQVEQWLGADDGNQEEGVVTGMAASPGCVEGIARVVRESDDLDQVQPGDILIATITAPSWGPIFGKIKATVTDIGGMMSHAAIVCREYGLPAVTGTGTGSTMIKTGDRVRVDGNTGRVEILS